METVTSACAPEWLGHAGPMLEVIRDISMAHRLTDRAKLRTTLLVLGHDSLVFSLNLSGFSVVCVLTPFRERVQLKSCVSLWVHPLSSHNDTQSHTAVSSRTGLLPYLVKTLLEHLHDSHGHGYHRDFETFLHHYRFCLEIGTLYKYNQLCCLCFSWW